MAQEIQHPALPLLKARFSEIKFRVREFRGQVTVVVPRENLVEVCRYLRDEPIQARPLSPVRRAIYWSMGIPIVGALLGRRVIEPSPAHTWTQRGILTGTLLILFAAFAWWPLSSWQSQKLPATIRFAAGQSGGSEDRRGQPA